MNEKDRRESRISFCALFSAQLDTITLDAKSFANDPSPRSCTATPLNRDGSMCLCGSSPRAECSPSKTNISFSHPGPWSRILVVVVLEGNEEIREKLEGKGQKKNQEDRVPRGCAAGADDDDDDDAGAEAGFGSSRRDFKVS